METMGEEPMIRWFRRLQCWMLENDAAIRGDYRSALMWAQKREDYR